MWFGGTHCLFIFELLKERTDLSVWRNTVNHLQMVEYPLKNIGKRIHMRGNTRISPTSKLGNCFTCWLSKSLQINYSVLGYADYTCSFQPTSLFVLRHGYCRRVHFQLLLFVPSVIDSPVEIGIGFPIENIKSSTHHKSKYPLVNVYITMENHHF